MQAIMEDPVLGLVLHRNARIVLPHFLEHSYSTDFKFPLVLLTDSLLPRHSPAYPQLNLLMIVSRFIPLNQVD